MGSEYEHVVASVARQGPPHRIADIGMYVGGNYLGRVEADLSERPANADMIEGFRDGYDRNAPEPSSNRSNSYRHGFMVGRLDNTPADYGKYTTAQLSRMADEAMEADEPRGV